MINLNSIIILFILILSYKFISIVYVFEVEIYVRDVKCEVCRF